MALIDKASLLFVPSVVAEGKAFNILPSGNRAPDSTDQNSGYDQTRADFDFDRGSNTAATRIGSDGLIKKYRENLLVNSNQFDTTWVNANSSETSGQADKDGGTNAWKIDLTGVSGRIYQSKSQSGVVTFSVYAKKGTLDWVILSSNIVDASFNLATGEKGTLVAGITSSIEDIGGGWYRCSCTGSGAFTQFRIYPAIADNTFTATSGNIYIQDAQAETSLVATDYLESTSVTGKAGVLVDLPRINYDANGENGSLLLEPSRQNLVQFSEWFGASGWALDGGTQSVTNNYSISPEGVKNAARLQLDKTGTTYSRLYVDAGSVGEATISVYMKSNTSQTQNVGLRYDGTGVNCEVPTEWKRFDLTATSTSVSRFQILLFDSIAGNDETADISIYGAMLEQNATYASSYIPNHGTSGGVTRAADSCSVTGASDVIGQTEGTIYWEGIAQPNDNPILVQLIPSAAGNYTNTIYLEYVHSVTEFKVQAWDTGVKQVQINTGAVTAGQVYKLAFAYKANDFALYMNGTQIGTDTSGSVQSGLDKIGLGSLNGTTNAAFYGSEAKQAALFKERLSNAELATLTTL